LGEPWLSEMRELLGEAKLPMPADTAFRSTGKQGVHSEHMGYILADMQYLQRAYPGGAW
jgi:ring-1,2-phenylacetyl-CoA epoxidase subunit PaaC